MGDKPRADVPPGFERHPLERRAEGQPHHRRGIVGGELPVAADAGLERNAAGLVGELDCPGANGRIGIVEETFGARGIELPRHVHRPDDAEPLGCRRRGGELRVEQPADVVGQPAGDGPLMEEPAGVADEPVVVMSEEIDELGIALRCEVDLHRGGVATVVHHLEDPAVAAIVLLVFAVVALVAVIPVDEHHLPVGPCLEGNELRPGVVGEEKVGLAVADIARTDRREPVLIEPGAVDVVHEQLVAVAIGPRAAEVDAGPAVGMAAAAGVRLLPVGIVPLASSPVTMAGDRLDVVEGPGVEVLASLALVTGPLDDVVEVGDHAGGLEGMTEIVEIDPPGIARPF